MLSRIEKALDQTVFPVVSFTDAPVDSIVSWATKGMDEIVGGIVYIVSDIDPNAMVLPPSTDAVTLDMRNVTCRTVLNATCYEAHLSWRLETRYAMGWPQITVARPEKFLESLAIEKKRSESWEPILVLLAIGSIFLIPVLLISFLRLAVQGDLAIKFLGRKYSYLLEPSLRSYVTDLAVGSLIDKVLPVPSDLILAAWLRHLMESDRKAAVKYVYMILMSKGDKVPKKAWIEFYKRNTEAKNLKCPVNLGDEHE
jgi:hypothetical protein